jgi:hypothetical protein
MFAVSAVTAHCRFAKDRHDALASLCGHASAALSPNQSHDRESNYYDVNNSSHTTEKLTGSWPRPAKPQVRIQANQPKSRAGTSEGSVPVPENRNRPAYLLAGPLPPLFGERSPASHIGPDPDSSDGPSNAANMPGSYEPPWVCGITLIRLAALMRATRQTSAPTWSSS